MREGKPCFSLQEQGICSVTADDNSIPVFDSQTERQTTHSAHCKQLSAFPQRHTATHSQSPGALFCTAVKHSHIYTVRQGLVYSSTQKELQTGRSTPPAHLQLFSAEPPDSPSEQSFCTLLSHATGASSRGGGEESHQNRSLPQ